MEQPWPERTPGQRRGDVALLDDDPRAAVLGPIRVLDPLGGPATTGRVWTYLGDRGHPYIVFDFTPNREGAHPRHFLQDFRGYLQAGAYAGYDELPSAPPRLT